jgi:hypothetical protein
MCESDRRYQLIRILNISLYSNRKYRPLRSSYSTQGKRRTKKKRCEDVTCDTDTLKES